MYSKNKKNAPTSFGRRQELFYGRQKIMWRPQQLFFRQPDKNLLCTGHQIILRSHLIILIDFIDRYFFKLHLPKQKYPNNNTI